MTVAKMAPRLTVGALAGIAVGAMAIGFLTTGPSEASLAQAQDDQAKPRPATWFHVRGNVRRATLTSVCGSAASGGAFCGETTDELGRPLPIRARDRVAVRTRPNAGRVTAYLIRLRDDRHSIRSWVKWRRTATEVAGSDGRRWRFRLPQARKLWRGDALHVFFGYPSGAAYPNGVTARQATYTAPITRR